MARPALLPTLADTLRAAGESEPVLLHSILQVEQIAEILRAGQGAHVWVTTVFETVERPISPADSFRFWKNELKPRVMRDGVMAQGLYPDNWAYLVSQWRSPFAEPLLQAKKCIY